MTRDVEREKLRIGLIVDRAGSWPWQCRMAAEIRQDSRLVLSQVLLVDDVAAGPRVERLPGWQSNLASRLLGLIEAIERRLFVPGRVLGRTNVCEDLTQPQQVHLQFGSSLDAGTVSSISGLDLIVALVPISDRAARQLADHTAVWAISAGDTDGVADPHFGFRDMASLSGQSRLAILEISDAGLSLVAEAVLQRQFCYALNKAFLQEKSVALILRELRRRSRGARSESAAPSQRPFSGPGRLKIASILSYLLKLGTYLAAKVYKMALKVAGRRVNKWSIFVGRGDFSAAEMSHCHEVRPPLNESWADPFLFHQKGNEQVHVFFENYDFTTRQGKISVGRLHSQRIEFLGDVLVSEKHLSYPFVFAHQDEIYLIPETAQHLQIEIWKATCYPREWVLHKVVMQGRSCVDTTIFQHDGEWWMFTNISTDLFDDHCSELHIFKVDSPLLNEIEPHALNPVVIDARTARNAGRIAMRDGVLTRLAQNNAYHYGYGFSLMEIERLNLSEYRERCLYFVEPGFVRGVTSTHHLDHLHGAYVFDGQRELG